MDVNRRAFAGWLALAASLTTSLATIDSASAARKTSRSHHASKAGLSKSGPKHASRPKVIRPRPEKLTRFAAAGEAVRPSVILLHGSNGIEPHESGYRRYAEALAAHGIDTWILRYFTDADRTALSRGRAERERYEADRYPGWAADVAATITDILAQPQSSGQVGLLGFSLGGFVAATTATLDPRIAALAVLYGGLPQSVVARHPHLPPTLALRGDADRNVDPHLSDELVALAKAAGSEAQLINFPGRVHGFDFQPGDPASAQATDAVVGFFVERLVQHPAPAPAPLAQATERRRKDLDR